MTPELLAGKNVIVQGITGTHGTFHTRTMKASGTHIVAGTSPTKAGSMLDDIPVYATVSEILMDMTVDTSVIFVPAAHAKAAIIEAINAQIPLIVCITEGVPIHDMLQIKQHLEKGSSILIGPNCPGLLMPSVHKLGIIPTELSLPGAVGIVSRSGTLTYEAMAGLTLRGIGQKYIIGIGGDPIPGSTFVDCLRLFQNDSEVDSIVMIGEIGGTSECEAADFIAEHVTKPVYAYVAGHHAPVGVQLGHAGAILGTQGESAGVKTDYLAARGITTRTSITGLISAIAERQ